VPKISKSDLPIDRRSWQEIQQDFFKQKSEHFAVGTRVKIAHLAPAEILSVEDGLLTCRTDDGSIFRIRPIALNR
jgi:hypothetical protein